MVKYNIYSSLRFVVFLATGSIGPSDCKIKRRWCHSPVKEGIHFFCLLFITGVRVMKGGACDETDSARNTASWFMNSAAKGSADFIVDDFEAIQYNPDPANRYCWAVGDKRYVNHKGGSLYGIAKNSNTISIEICSSSKDGKVHDGNDSRWYFTDAAVDRAVELAKYLMKKYNIPADRLIRHYDCSGKFCPGIIGSFSDTSDSCCN